MGIFVFSILVIVVSVVIFLFGGGLNVNKRFSKLGSIAGIVVGVILLFSSMIIIIDAGEVGVVVEFGKVRSKVLKSGINVVPPYANIYKYSVRINEITQAEGKIIEARVSDGLIVNLDCTVLFALDPDKVVEIYTKISQSLSDLQDKVLLTTLRTIIRNVVSKYTSGEVYASKREQVSNEIQKEMQLAVADKGIIIDKFFIRAIKLPEEIDKSIQVKISAQQEAEAMTYRKQKAVQEAEIKVIEAEGLARAQRIINSTLTPNYIQLEAIGAYKALANSPNTTFIIMPTSPNGAGIPLILNGAK